MGVLSEDGWMDGWMGIFRSLFVCLFKLVLKSFVSLDFREVKSTFLSIFSV